MKRVHLHPTSSLTCTWEGARQTSSTEPGRFPCACWGVLVSAGTLSATAIHSCS